MRDSHSVNTNIGIILYLYSYSKSRAANRKRFSCVLLLLSPLCFYFIGKKQQRFEVGSVEERKGKRENPKHKSKLTSVVLNVND